MDLVLCRIPHEAGKWDVVRAIADALHSDDFHPPGIRKTNFQVKLSESTVSAVRNAGIGVLTLPATDIAWKFLHWAQDNPIKILDPATGKQRKIKVYKGKQAPQKYLVETLSKTLYMDPDKEEAYERKKLEVAEQFRVDSVQFGTFYRDCYPPNEKGQVYPRCFSIEYGQELLNDEVGWLRFEYDHKLLRITIYNPISGSVGYSIAINFSAIQKIGVGYDGKPYVCFDTSTPPVLESFEISRAQTDGDDKNDGKYKRRIGSLNPTHLSVAPYAPHLRILLYRDNTRDIIEKFVKMCKACDLSDNIIIRCDFPKMAQIEASEREFFTPKTIYRLRQEFKKYPWPVAFQLEALLHNGKLHTEEIKLLLPHVKKLCEKHSGNDSSFVGDFLRKYQEVLRDRSAKESPMKCFDRVLKKYVAPKVAPSTFRCYHVTFTPTRVLMEGPYPTQSNRIIRQYVGYKDYFLRVDFRDEDRLQYRWSKDVDGASFVRERVGGVLKDGFEVAGRHFDFLAYSNSALREHAVWFMSPFNHKALGWVSAERIRSSIGNFRGDILLRQPSKYAARLAQAFTATEASVVITRDQWEEVEDIKPERLLDTEPNEYLFTDGLGSISKTLGDRIWNELCRNRRDSARQTLKPSAYQIRFLGYKGVVAIDEKLDKYGDGIHMRLRKSMRKFEPRSDDSAPIEIAQAFQYPNKCYLNRPLVMLLEDLGVSKDAILELQEKEIAAARTIHDNIEKFRSVLHDHGLGRPFKFSWLIKKLQDLGLEINNADPGKPNVDSSFLRQVREVAMMDIMRDIKHSAKILIPQSYLLVGVADEGPAYVKAGFENVFCLPPGCIYVCIQQTVDEEPIWLEGPCAVTRSPVAYIGDIQRVRALGKPPQGKLCLFSHLRNVLVMSSQGQRSLASCLGGGDVDGDLFQVIQCESLLPPSYELPADYNSIGTKSLEHDSTVEDICDFVVEYINSDLLGLLSDRLLTIADQSLDGMNDERCKSLAELCSQAVDYPKNGIPVDLTETPLPSTLIRCKPDWHAAEVVSPRETDYYISTRALGYLYRNISLTEPKPIDQEASCREPLDDPISQALRERVTIHIGNLVLPVRTASDELETLYQRYIEELNYIRSTHTLSNTSGVKLSEGEIVAGTILAKCSQKRWRSDRMYRMRLHTTELVKDIRNEFLEQSEVHALEELVRGLERAWRAWEYSQMRPSNEVGSNSFGFIALGSIFYILELLDGGGQVAAG